MFSGRIDSVLESLPLLEYDAMLPIVMYIISCKVTGMNGRRIEDCGHGSASLVSIASHHLAHGHGFTSEIPSNSLPRDHNHNYHSYQLIAEAEELCPARLPEGTDTHHQN